MSKKIIGIERNIPYDFQGHKGVTNRLYLIDPDESSYSRDNGSDFIGRKCEFVKVPRSFNVNDFAVGDEINVFYNRYGQVEQIQLI